MKNKTNIDWYNFNGGFYEGCCNAFLYRVYPIEVEGQKKYVGEVEDDEGVRLDFPEFITSLPWDEEGFLYGVFDTEKDAKSFCDEFSIEFGEPDYGKLFFETMKKEIEMIIHLDKNN